MALITSGARAAFDPSIDIVNIKIGSDLHKIEPDRIFQERERLEERLDQAYEQKAYRRSTQNW
ncbi:MAG: hypothetical protein WCC94_05820 [Candidatus Bathyarchaeia archaeon]